MPDLLTLGQYRRSVNDYLVRLKQDNITDQRAVAQTGGSSYAFLQYSKDRFAFSLDWVTQAHSSGRIVSDLDIKSDYLGQLLSMRNTLSPPEKQDQRLLGQFNVAQKSADATRLNITLENLRKSTIAKLEQMLTNGSIQHLFINRGLMAYGLQSAAAIQLQCPGASQLVTRRQLAAARLPWPTEVRPLVVYAPILRLYFERNGQWLPSSAATGTEQRGIAMGSVSTRQDIQYAANQVYDISQLPSNYQRNLLTQNNDVAYTYDVLLKFASAAKSEQGFGINIQEREMHGLSVSSFYDTAQNTIFISKGANSEYLVKSFLNSLSEATVALTSYQPAAIQQFEVAMLSLQLQATGGLPSSAADFTRAAETFAATNSFLDASHHLPGTMTALEASFARVDRMASFIHHHVSNIQVSSQEMGQEQTRNKTQSTLQGQKQQTAQTEQITNFLGEIH